MTDPIFNQICYMARYPDLRLNPTMARYGNKWYYGLQPAKGPFGPDEKFNVNDSPLKHFQVVGMSEGRVGGCDLPGTIYSDKFDSVPYMNRYPDLKGTWVENNPLLHFTEYGSKEGRKPGYEIINANSLSGLVSPGTTITATDHVDSHVPGDGVVPVIPSDGSTPVISPGSNNILSTIEKNPIIAAVIGGVLMIVLFKKKDNRK